MSTTLDQAGAPNGRRKLLVSLVLGAFAAIGIAFAFWWFNAGRYYESTDDAYVGGNLVQITPQVPGTVLAIHADDTDFVRMGQTLVELDKADSRVALDQAEAQLARTVRSVRNLVASTTELESNVELRRSDLAKAAWNAARRQLAAQSALVDHTTLEDHPDVQNAAARVREAYLAAARTELPAPVSGFVARRAVQVGQRVSPGTPLMTVVPLDQVWVDANFKEGQLANLRAGQPVRLLADAYGRAVKYRGQLVGFGAGTGSAFALLPAQNATGNWIKVVQRVPVRIALDPQELREHPLQIGLSMQVDVDTHERAGERLPKVSRAPAYETRAFARTDQLADQRIAEIIASNGGDLHSIARREPDGAARPAALRPQGRARVRSL